MYTSSLVRNHILENKIITIQRAKYILHLIIKINKNAWSKLYSPRVIRHVINEVISQKSSLPSQAISPEILIEPVAKRGETIKKAPKPKKTIQYFQDKKPTGFDDFRIQGSQVHQLI